MLKFKLALAGAKDVGKSSLIARYCDNVFSEEMMGTIGVAFKRKKIQFEEGPAIEATIWDFGGEEKYRTLFPKYVNGAIAALILYDTTRKNTIEDIHELVDIIDAYADGDVIKVLIGTKIDLEDQRDITKEEVNEICSKYNWCAEIIETSAKTGENVEEAFLNVFREIVENKFHRCSGCKEYFPRKIKFCTNCGNEAENFIPQY